MTREKRNHIRHHQPQKPTVRESGVAPDGVYGWKSEMAEHYLDAFRSRYPEAVRTGEHGGAREYQPEVLRWWARRMFYEKTKPKE